MSRWTSSAVSARQEVITPEIAAEMLAASKGNRHQRRWHVEWLASMMRRGEWRVTNQGIGFTRDGVLIDGHHRLSAVVKSGCTVQMLVALGLEPKVYLDIDQGRVRNAADIHGAPKRIAEVLRLLGRIIFNIAHPRDLGPLFSGKLRDTTEELQAFCAHTTAVLSAAPVRSAVVIIALDDAMKHQAFSAYRTLATRDYTALTPALAQLCRVIEGKNWCGYGAGLDVFAMTLQSIRKLDDDKAFRFTGASKAEQIAWARDVVRAELEKGGAK